MRTLGNCFVGLVLLAHPALAFAGQDLSFDALPAAVKATVTREVKSGRVLEIEQDTKRGQPVFEIEFMDGNVKWEIDVSPDGTLLQRRED
ncbi:MAG TPA: PepSY domain-containing protein [Polyangiaceae bacterium]